MYDDRSPSRSPGGNTLLPHGSIGVDAFNRAVQFLFPTRQMLTIFSAQKIIRTLPHEALLRIEDPIIPETTRTQDPVTEVETAMISDDGH
jgi:hypothetical protein